MSLQEKFQIVVPAKEEAAEPWVDVQTARDNQGNPSPDGDQKFNNMPTGYAIKDNRAEFQCGFGGDTDVSGGVTPKVLVKGYDRKDMKGSDDQYSGEHVDLFYGDSGGFVERNNYLDRI